MKKVFIFLYLFVGVALIVALLAVISKPQNFQSRAENPNPAVLEISPSKINLGLGERAKIDILANTNGIQIDGFTVRIAYPKETIKIVNIEINSPYESILKWISPNGEVVISGVLPPKTTANQSGGKFVLGSLTIEGLQKNNNTSISFNLEYSKFQLVGNGNQFNLLSGQTANICIYNQVQECLPENTCSLGKPTIIYPIKGKKTLDPQFEIAFKITGSCFPQEYKVVLKKSSGEKVCESNWKNDLKSDEVKRVYGSEIGCPLMTTGEYRAELTTRYQNQTSETDISSFTYSYIYEGFSGIITKNFIGVYGTTDVVIPSTYNSFSRRGTGNVSSYVTSGKPIVSADSAFFAWRECYKDQNLSALVPPAYQSHRGCLGYSFRKLREMAINFGGIGSLSIDDTNDLIRYLRAYDNFNMTLGQLKTYVVSGIGGKMGISWYEEMDCPTDSTRNQIDWVFLYAHHKKNFKDSLEKTKACFSGAQIIAGIYPRSMRGLFPNTPDQEIKNLTDEREIAESCQQAKTAIEWLKKGEIIGIEIYDNSPLDQNFSFYDLDKKIAQLTSDIFATGDSPFCQNP